MMIMETIWYKLPDRDRYEVSDEEKPRVRNSKTGTILKQRPNGTVCLYFNTHLKSVQETPVRLLFAAINGIKIGQIPKSVIVTRENGEFRLTDRSDFCNSLNNRFDIDVDTETQLTWLRETQEFLCAQAEAVRNRQFGELALFLYKYRKRASMLSAQFCYAKHYMFDEINEYANTAVVRVVERVRRGVVLTQHPTAVLKNEIIKIIRHNKKTVRYDENGRS